MQNKLLSLKKNHLYKKSLLKTRTFLGHKTEKNLVHPSMKQFLIGTRKPISFINIDSTLNNMIKSLYIVLSVIKQNGHILVVNTNPEIQSIVNQFRLNLKECKDFFSFCNTKWVGGTLTNWNQISNSIITYSFFSKRFGNFIAQNNIHFPRYRKLKKSFQGFINNEENFTHSSYLNKLPLKKKKSVNLKKPDILIIINPNENNTILHEAKKLNIPVIALSDTNTNLSLITYPIPVNNTSPFFIQFFFSWIIRLVKSNEKK